MSITDVEVREELLRGNLSTGNARPHHEDVLLPLGGAVGMLGLANVAIVLLIDAVVLDEMLRVLAELMIMPQLFGERPAQLTAPLLDDFHHGTLGFLGHRPNSCVTQMGEQQFAPSAPNNERTLQVLESIATRPNPGQAAR